MFYICSMDVKTLDPGVKAELDSESEDEVLMATSIPLKEELSAQTSTVMTRLTLGMTGT